jgi:hypothetical protein
MLDELSPLAHTESSVVNLLYHLPDHLSRGFLSTDDQFRARSLK